jgi:23S rRNA (pseudouridine1915-N3)-methyltransferase
MKITLITLGKTTSLEIKNIFEDYAKRVNRYTKFSEVTIENNAGKTTDVSKTKEKEGELILKKIATGDLMILLDEKGKEFTSEQFAAYLENLISHSRKNICFVIGGAFGFSEAVYQRADAKVSLSKMTFNHQLIRVIFAEQLYRAFTIIHNEKYHHS